MKRQLALRETPIKTKKKGKVVTVQTVENILILNIYQDKDLICRYCMNTDTGEYETWDAKTEEWSVMKAHRAAGGLDWYDNGRSVEKTVKYDPPEASALIKKALDGKTWRRYAEGLELIDEVETDYGRDQREKKEERRMERERKLQNRVPELPADFRQWILKAAGGGKHFLFWDKEKKQYICTACGGQSNVKIVPGKHNDWRVCPSCNARAQIKRRTAQVMERRKVCIMQDIGADMSVCRHFDVRMEWTAAGESVHLSEGVRIMPLRGHKKYACQIRYNCWGRDDKGVCFDKTNPGNRKMGKCYLSPQGIRECLAGTEYEDWTGIMEWMAQKGMCADYNRMMACADRRIHSVVEYLAKGRFYRLLEETTEQISLYFGSYNGILHLYGDTAEEVLGLEDRQKVNRLRDADGGEAMLEWLRWSDESGEKLPQEALEWALQEKVSPGQITGGMSLLKFKNYIIRQQAESYPGKPVKTVIEQYRDYLGMCQRMGKDLSDEMVSRPRQLKRRHDEVVEEIRQQEILDNIAQNREAWEKKAQEMADKYPGAEENLAAVRDIYEYTGEEYMVLVPRRLVDIAVEGNALHHCAGSSDRYFERIRNRETYVFFLRKVSAPDAPYYTLEVEPGGTIRQHRTYMDEETGIENVRGFLREWQKVIKKRLTASERELAKISAVKREENLQELREKNNTRVLQGLMEDFMEAV